MGENQGDNNGGGAGDRVTISEAAALLGVHPKAVRKRVRGGMYHAEKVLTKNGPTWMIERQSLTTNVPTSSNSLVGVLHFAGSFFREHPAIFGSLVYLQVTIIGVVYSWVLFRRFGINIFDYAEANDFLLAAFKDPFAFGMSMLTIFLIIALQVLAIVFVRWRAKRRMRLEATTSDTSSNTATLSESTRLMEFWFSLMGLLFLIVVYSLAPPYLIANLTADSLQGPTDAPLMNVQYRATVGSNEQKRETGLRVIGTTPNFVFFYDRKETRTLIIPSAQIVEMTHCVKKEPLCK